MSSYYSYEELYNYLRRARDPVVKGRKFTAAFKLFDCAGTVEIRSDGRAIARV